MMQFLSLFTPIAYADTIGAFVGRVNKFVINPIIILMFAFALVFFIVGVLQYLLNPANDEERATGRQHILWGVVGMAIMISVWGIMTIIAGKLGASYVENNINQLGGEVHVQ